MKRLRDLDSETPLQQRAKELLASVDPVSDSHDRMVRVRRRLEQTRAGSGTRPAARRMPALAVAALVGLFGASAFAAVRMFVLQAPATEAAPRAEQSKKPRLKEPAPKPSAAAQVELAEPPARIEMPTETQADVQPDDRPASSQRKPALRTRAKQQAGAQAGATDAEATHDSELVHRAVQALRRVRNPKLAARLLEQDRVHNPNGPLAEEALSLRIEAALQLGDPRARAFAEQYVARYPRGRYLSIARRALGDGKR